MAVGTRRITWDDLSPSCRSAFGWAAAAVGSGNPVSSTAILYGIVRAHEGTSHAEDLLHIAGTTRDDLFRALEKSREGEVQLHAGTPAPLREIPALTAEATVVVTTSRALSDDFPQRDRKIHLQHVFGGVLSSSNTARDTLASLLSTDIESVNTQYRAYLEAQASNPSLRYGDFLASAGSLPGAPSVPEQFFGREAERKAAAAALRGGRNVLVVGPPGIGKSAFASVVANDLSDDFPDGIYTLLLRRRPAEEVAGAIIAGSGLVPQSDTISAYHRFLAQKRALVVLEDAGPGVQQLMPRPPALAIVTSREPLQLSAETIALKPFAGAEVAAFLEELGISGSPDELRQIADVTMMSPALLGLVGQLSSEGLEKDDLLGVADALRELPQATTEAAPGVDPARLAAVQMAYASLAPDERMLFRRLALLEGVFAGPEAGAVADTSLEHAEAVLAHLASLDLVDPDDDGRYSFDAAGLSHARASFSIEEDTVRQHETAIRAAAAAKGIGLATRFTPALAGHVADTPSSVDHLDFDPDVEALCSVLVAKDVEPPISVGLFGDWGTGKSTFMWLMRQRVRELAVEWRGRDDSPFHLNVKQITFNAWHYSDANLWASIATRIFEGLAQPDPEVKDDTALSEDELAAVAGELETARLQVTEKQREVEEARARESVLELRRQELRDEESDALARLTSISPQDILAEAAQDPDVMALGQRLDEEVGGVGGDTVATARDLRFLGGRLKLVWRRLPHRRVVVAGLLAALIVIVLGIWLASTNGWFAALPVGAVVVWIAGAAAVARPVLGRVRQAAATARAYLERLEERQATRRKLVEVAIQQELSQLAAHRTQIEHELDAARLDAARAEREIEDIRTGRRLARFVEERAASADYAAYLGLIALIRRDFDRLRFLLRESRNATKPQIERIILYIDDLDRCPASRVVQVLEAVHLLLALDLFVVVVGVDPRWLVKSLERHYSAQLGAQNGDWPLPHDLPDDWTTTPQNYLEKIFQIPLAIRPMGKRGFERLVGNLLDVRAPERAETEETTEREPPEPLAEIPPEVPDDQPRTPDQPRPTTAALQLERLSVWPAELQFLQKLSPLVPTPRAAKRLANTYRLIRAGLDARALRTFVRDDGKTGEYQSALILLGILIGAPADSRTVFRALVQTDTDDLKTFVDAIVSLAPEDAEASRRLGELHEKLKRVLAAASPDGRLQPYKEWAPRISRYSFETGRTFVDAVATDTASV